MPNYVPTDWADGITPVDEAHLDKIEAGIVGAVPRDGVMASGQELLRNSFAAGDAFAGFTLGAEGAMYFGAGGASVWDARIYRSAPYTLHLGSVLEIEQHLTIGTVTNAYLNLKSDANGINFGAAADTNLYRSSAGVLKSDSHFHSMGHLLANEGSPIQIAVGVDHGGGAAMISFHSSQDTNLYRSAAGQLKTDGEFLVGGSIHAVGNLNVASVNASALVRAGYGSPGNNSQVVLGNAFGNDFPVIAFADGAEYIYRSSPGILTTSAGITSQNANNGFTFSPPSLGGTALFANVQGEAQPRFYIDYGGFHRWGDGAVAPDISLYRSGANALAITGNITVEKTVAAGVALPSNNFAFYTGYSEGSGIAFLIRNQGRLEWGDGVGGALDTFLYRSAANTLKTDGAFVVGGSSLFLVQGVEYWGSAADASISYVGAGTLRVNHSFQAVNFYVDPTDIGGRIFFGSLAAESLYRQYAGMLTVNSDFTVSGFLSAGKNRASGYGVVIGNSGTPGFNLFLNNDGVVRWGDGSEYSGDTTLYRSGAGVLKTDGQLQVVGTLYGFSDILAGNGTAGEIWLAGNSGQPAIYFHNSHDTYIYRPTPQNLQTNARFRAAGGFEFGDGTVQTTAAGGASTPGTKTLISEQTLVANSGSGGVISTAIPAGYREIEITIEAVMTGPTNGDILVYTFDPTPSPGTNMLGGAAGSGDGSGYSPNTGPVTIGRSMYHGVMGTPDYIFFCKIEILPGYDAARRHAMFYRTISHRDVAGNSNDVNVLQGGVQWPNGSPFSAMTGFNLKCQGGQGFGVGSRILVYGVK